MVKKFKRCFLFIVIMFTVGLFLYVFNTEIKQKMCNIFTEKCNLVNRVQETSDGAGSGISQTANAGQSPHPFYRTNAKRTGMSPYLGPDRPNIRWKYSVNGLIEASPVIGANGRVYAASQNGSFYAISKRGQLLWQVKTGDLNRNSPAIGEDGTIYLPSSDNNLYAITHNGQIKWVYRTAGRVNSAPVIGKDGNIYFGSHDKYVYALKQDGSLIWKTRVGAVSASSVAISDDGTIYVGSYDTHLYALTPNGEVKWSIKLESGIRTTPAIGSTGMIYVGTRGGRLFAVSPDGTIDWSFKTGDDIRASVAIWTDEDGKDVIYVGSWDKKIYALSKSGNVIWSYKTNGPIEASPVVDKNGNVYVGAITDKIYSFTHEGVVRWTINGGMLNTSVAIDYDGTLYICREHNVIAIGEPYPIIDLAIGSNSVDIELKNLAFIGYKMDLKVFYRSFTGETLPVGNDKVELDAGGSKTIQYTLPEKLKRNQHLVAKLIDSTDGSLIATQSVSIDSPKAGGHLDKTESNAGKEEGDNE